jgi:hypothetical protein
MQAGETSSNKAITGKKTRQVRQEGMQTGQRAGTAGKAELNKGGIDGQDKQAGQEGITGRGDG